MTEKKATNYFFRNNYLFVSNTFDIGSEPSGKVLALSSVVKDRDPHLIPREYHVRSTSSLECHFWQCFHKCKLQVLCVILPA